MKSQKLTVEKGNILVVDDAPANLRLVSAMLTNQGYTVRSMTSGRMAIMSAQEDPPDLILLDVNMPDMNGYEVCRQLKAEAKTNEIPVIFISGLGEILDKLQGFVVGGVDYVTKPFQTAEVLARIESQLHIRRMHIQLQAQSDRLQQEVSDRIAAEANLQKNNQVLQELARLDSLTEVANRRYFDAYLRREWQESAKKQKPLSLIMSRVDFFQDYNDIYGFYEGDMCLQKVAAAIHNVVEHPQSLVARYAGAEFAVVLPDLEVEQAVYTAELMRTQIKNLMFPHEGSPIGDYVTLSTGVTGMVPILGSPPTILITAADYALYQAEEEGHDRIYKIG